jgi:hypothetical protein
MRERFVDHGVGAESEQQDDSGDVDWIAELAWKNAARVVYILRRANTPETRDQLHVEIDILLADGRSVSTSGVAFLESLGTASDLFK